MFSGIIEGLGKVDKIEKEGGNIHFHITSPFYEELYIDQSIAHNGVCLTVVKINGKNHVVTAIEETLEKSNLGFLRAGDLVNLERCIKADARLDGHFVQGHVDTKTKCINIKEMDGSWYFTFALPEEYAHLIVDKGSIAINGTSLTVVDPTLSSFKVAIIPFTYEHTNFHTIKEGDMVNVEFDILGKYLSRYLEVTEKVKD